MENSLPGREAAIWFALGCEVAEAQSLRGMLLSGRQGVALVGSRGCSPTDTEYGESRRQSGDWEKGQSPCRTDTLTQRCQQVPE